MSTTAEFILTGLIIFPLSLFAIASSFNNPSFSLVIFRNLSFFLSFSSWFFFFSSQSPLFFFSLSLNNYLFFFFLKSLSLDLCSLSFFLSFLRYYISPYVILLFLHHFPSLHLVLSFFLFIYFFLLLTLFFTLFFNTQHYSYLFLVLIFPFFFSDGRFIFSYYLWLFSTYFNRQTQISFFAIYFLILYSFASPALNKEDIFPSISSFYLPTFCFFFSPIELVILIFFFFCLFCRLFLPRFPFFLSATVERAMFG
ncbi:unnamed protein product [Acanthosepion pharaonis]|uniref:Uncharacterized protein n=1 Tax=Acanthosepion pharaonis TaxID=158019 RepID=A0A812EW23_ACAPH|nr:unnamed protein product [Sepia pharaonis]